MSGQPNQAKANFPKCLWDLPFVNRGVSGIVFAVDELSVIKTPTGGEENAEELRVEREILERLGDHPRIVKLLYTYKDLIVLERLRYPLRFRTWELREDGRTASLDDVLKWSAQAAEGMQYFHAKGVFQVDVGLHNLLVDWDDNVKYCDFSGSSIDGSRPTVVVSPTAQHPTAVIGSPTVQTELFSLGSAIYEISTTFKAYEGLEEHELQARYARGEYPDTSRLLLGGVILKCWRGCYSNAGEVAAEIRGIQRRMKHGNDLSLSINGLMERKRSEHTRVYIRMQLFIAAAVFGAQAMFRATTINPLA
ncbi:hypothetical protein TRV_08002 [Trichophyton verrucosum HKI 0517]|uniref:Protein kinase domain-containing protein n=1 Tax=Trichophyton verrucosum (strain HKI 0517) TaxID=663202 RepID=D4DLC8_TRIVH|nr:uncharacterized protein TRV_08002 [Trichophyton verrucosum HKI 0517]EFE37353.1 hypothetical protein TRV_08002 [Trichophyton verrucosum HKI 0517]